MFQSKYVCIFLILLWYSPLANTKAIQPNTFTYFWGLRPHYKSNTPAYLWPINAQVAPKIIPIHLKEQAPLSTEQSQTAKKEAQQEASDEQLIPTNNAPDLADNLEEAAPKASTAQDTNPTPEEGGLQSVITYDAQDYIVLDIKHETIHLHGSGTIEYDQLKLKAEDVTLDWANHTIAVCSKKNEAGEIEKKAVLTKDGVEYIAESIRYNFESHRATASKLVTKQYDGLLRTDKIKKDREDTFYTDQATYTTCNLVKPHFHIGAKNLKLIQDEQVFSGPFNLYFDNVPTPLGFFFGIFFFPKNSGIIPPKYGGESDKGFCLKDGGYYVKFNDYIDLALQGDIYSKGSTAFIAQSKYKKTLPVQRRLVLPTISRLGHSRSSFT